MRTLQGKAAVVTGAGSGIGRAIAARCCRAGMRVMLADIEREPLARVEAELRAGGAEVVAKVTDVSVEEDVQALATTALETFGAVDLLVNNAGVTTTNLSWEAPVADWRWVLGVNLFGVVHGIRAFVPAMLAREAEAHVVNVASVAGLLPAPGKALYAASKHAVVSLSESLHHELSMMGAPMGVSVLCPGFVRTRISDAERNRPESLRAPAAAAAPMQQAISQMARYAVENGWPPERIADEAIAAVIEGRFWVLPHRAYDPVIARRTEGLLKRKNPELPDPAELLGQAGEGDASP